VKHQAIDYFAVSEVSVGLWLGCGGWKFTMVERISFLEAP